MRRFSAALSFAFAMAVAAQVVSIPQQSGPTPTVVRAQAEPLDINTATPAQLRALPGMGDEYVRRIVAGRPYTAKNQLATRGILPEAAYRQIEGMIVAHRPKKQP